LKRFLLAALALSGGSAHAIQEVHGGRATACFQLKRMPEPLRARFHEWRREWTLSDRDRGTLRSEAAAFWPYLGRVETFDLFEISCARALAPGERCPTTDLLVSSSLVEQLRRERVNAPRLLDRLRRRVRADFPELDRALASARVSLGTAYDTWRPVRRMLNVNLPYRPDVAGEYPFPGCVIAQVAQQFSGGASTTRIEYDLELFERLSPASRVVLHLHEWLLRVGIEAGRASVPEEEVEALVRGLVAERPRSELEPRIAALLDAR
jgi:hypothetical protein